jgi:hypothetical protein
VGGWIQALLGISRAQAYQRPVLWNAQTTGAVQKRFRFVRSMDGRRLALDGRAPQPGWPAPLLGWAAAPDWTTWAIPAEGRFCGSRSADRFGSTLPRKRASRYHFATMSDQMKPGFQAR